MEETTDAAETGTAIRQQKQQKGKADNVLGQWGFGDSDEETNKTDDDVKQIASQIKNEQSGKGTPSKVDVCTQDYQGYFPTHLAEPKSYNLVPRGVSPERITKRNAQLVQQALNTRHLMAIPKRKIQTKKVPKKVTNKVKPLQAYEIVTQALGKKSTQPVSKASSPKAKPMPLPMPSYFMDTNQTLSSDHEKSTELSLNKMSMMAAKLMTLQSRDNSIAKVKEADKNDTIVFWVKNGESGLQASVSQERFKEMTFQNGFPMMKENLKLPQEDIATILPSPSKSAKMTTNPASRYRKASSFMNQTASSHAMKAAATLGERKSMHQCQSELFLKEPAHLPKTNIPGRSIKIILKRPPQTAAEATKSLQIKQHLEKKVIQAKTQKVGPGSYLNGSGLNMIGKHKPSNSVKGFGNGFISQADRGLQPSTNFANVGFELMRRNNSQPSIMTAVNVVPPALLPKREPPRDEPQSDKKAKKPLILPKNIGKCPTVPQSRKNNRKDEGVTRKRQDHDFNQKSLQQRVFSLSHTNLQSLYKVQQIRRVNQRESSPGPGAYEDQKPAIEKQIEAQQKKNELVAKKAEIHQKLRSKLSVSSKQQRFPSVGGHVKQDIVDLDTIPMIQIYDLMRQSGQKEPIPFESPNINITRERSQGAVIHPLKHAQTHAKSQAHVWQLKAVDDLAQSQSPNPRGGAKPQQSAISDNLKKQIDRFITNKATIQDDRKRNTYLGDDIEFQALTLQEQQANQTLNQSSLLYHSDDESLSSRMLSHNTLAHRLESMRRASKQSPFFCKKRNMSILKPDQTNQGGGPKLIPTPSIPMPERFYYEQNPMLLEKKFQKLQDDQELHQASFMPRIGKVTAFKRISSLDHLELMAKSNSIRIGEIKEQIFDKDDAEVLGLLKQNKDLLRAISSKDITDPKSDGPQGAPTVGSEYFQGGSSGLQTGPHTVIHMKQNFSNPPNINADVV